MGKWYDKNLNEITNPSDNPDIAEIEALGLEIGKLLNGVDASVAMNAITGVASSIISHEFDNPLKVGKLIGETLIASIKLNLKGGKK